MLASRRDEKYIDAIEKITGNKLERREMLDIEVREETRPRRDGDRHGGRGRERGRGRDGKHRDRRPPDGKYHEHVAGMEPVQASPDAVAAPPAPEPAAAATQQPRERHEKREHRPREQRPRGERQEQRSPSERQSQEKRERHSQRHHNEQAAKPEAVDKSQLPAFLFRPIPVKKPEPQK
jgi:hypothetical protein